MAIYQETHELPSRGILNGIKPEITIRNMTTSDEKTLLGSTPDAINYVLKDCLIEPSDLKLDDLISPDKHFLMLKLRIVSYGSIYPVSFKCSSCKETSEYKLDLDDLPINYLEEGFEEPYDEFELPKTKYKIALKIPRIKEMNDIETKAKRFHKKFTEAKGDIAYIYRLMANIATVDGKVLPLNDKQQLVEELPVMDTSYLKNRISKLKVGYDTEIIEECPRCGEEVRFELPITAEFFHTRYED
jgi:hypothetical protein